MNSYQEKGLKNYNSEKIYENLHNENATYESESISYSSHSIPYKAGVLEVHKIYT